jgi:hypothetical protein
VENVSASGFGSTQSPASIIDWFYPTWSIAADPHPKAHRKHVMEDYCGYFDPNIHNQGAVSEF